MKQSPLMTAWLGFRSVLLVVGFSLITGVMGFLAPLLGLFPYPWRVKYIQMWARLSLLWARITCGIKSNIRGYENLDLSQAAIILPNHQSTWETMYLLMKMPAMSFVIKKELLNIPFFGWGMSQSRPIAIDRSAGGTAVDQININGKERLDEGNWVCIFPEGTRVPPKQKMRFKSGGALLAVHSGYAVYPIAHNAGECWPKKGFIKTPGTITVSFGPRIEVEGKPASDVIKEVDAWITQERAALPPVR
jgi:1-acyl-sn-glycerol-3-phosphate acyltransferase